MVEEWACSHAEFEVQRVPHVAVQIRVTPSTHGRLESIAFLAEHLVALCRQTGVNITITNSAQLVMVVVLVVVVTVAVVVVVVLVVGRWWL